MNAATVLPASAAARPGIDAPTVRRPALSAWQALERGIDRWTGAALSIGVGLLVGVRAGMGAADMAAKTSPALAARG